MTDYEALDLACEVMMSEPCGGMMSETFGGMMSETFGGMMSKPSGGIMRHISITVGKNMFQRKKSTSPYTLIFHYHLNLVLKCCYCIATVLCFVYLAILYCTVLYLYLFICSWAIMALCINKVSVSVSV